MSDDTAYLICLRVSEGPPAALSDEGRCGVCGAPVWIAVSTTAFGERGVTRKPPAMRPICMPCAAELVPEARATIRCRLCPWTYRAVIDHSPAGRGDAARVARHFIVRHPEITTSPLGYFDVGE